MKTIGLIFPEVKQTEKPIKEKKSENKQTEKPKS